MKKLVQVKVIKEFRDKYTLEIYGVNKILNVSEERYNEIKNYVKLFEERAKKSTRRKG